MWLAIEITAVVLVATVCVTHVVTQFWFNKYGAHHNLNWVIYNFILGFLLALLALFESGANVWIGCAVGVASYISLYMLRIRCQIWWDKYKIKRALNKQFE